MLRYWIGAGFALCGVALIAAAVAHKSKVQAAHAAARDRGLVPPTGLQLYTLGSFGEMVRPIILFFLAVAALKITFGFLVFELDSVYSFLDLGGVLFAIAAYGTFVVMRTSYRLSDLDRWVPAAEAAPVAAPSAPAPAAEPAAERVPAAAA